MTADRHILIGLAAGGSALVLVLAFGFQHLGGMAPCPLCLWQRWPHALAVAIGAAALLLSWRALPLLGMLAALSTAAIGFYHTGVERHWWEGPATCSAGSVAGQSPEDLMAQIMAAPLVRCDEVPWEMLGLSMASWNAVLAIGLAGLWWRAARAPD